MKKIILILFFFISCVDIKAEVFYSDYGSYSAFTEEFIKEDDLISVDIQKRYKLYNEIRSNGNYYIEGNNEKDFPYIDRDDYIVTDFTDWVDKIPDYVPNRMLESKIIYEYSKMKKIRYIHLYNFYGNNGVFKIAELRVYSNNIEIPIKVFCENCSENFSQNVLDGNNYSVRGYVKNTTGYIRIDLNDYYDADTLLIVPYVADSSSEKKRYSLKFTREEDFNSRSYVKGNFNTYFQHQTEDIASPYSFNKKNYQVDDPLYEESKISGGMVLETLTTKVVEHKLYRYKDKLYRYYKYKKEYSNDYYSDKNDKFKYIDKENYKLYYRYKKREKFEIIDDLIIDSYNFNLYKFILNSTLDNIKVQSNVNEKINGIYSVKFILPFIEIERKVVVDIDENKKNEKEKIKEDLENIKNEQIKDLTNENKKLQDKLNLESSDLIKEFNKCKSLLDETGKNNLLLINEINNCNQRIINQNQNIDSLKRINNNNLDIYNKKINEIKFSLTNLENKNNKLNNSYNMCLNSKKEYYNQINSIKSSSHDKKIILLIILLITIISSGIYIKHKKM